MQQKINNGISTTAAADCIASHWLMLHQLFSGEKYALSVTASRTLAGTDFSSHRG